MPKNPFKDLFLINPNIHFLNHGSFGATPRVVFEEYQKWQRELEIQPVEFLGRKFAGLLSDARNAIAGFLNTDKQNLVFVPNTTTGINTIARFLHLEEGDEVVITDHEYGAVERTWRYLSQRYHFKLIIAEIPVPVMSHKGIVDSIFNVVCDKTKVISISHITSSTSMIFPVAELTARAREMKILSVIDGAHAPGQIKVQLDEINPDFYVGNFHKWLCAPKGSAFLFANPKVQHLVEPLIVSWGWESELPSNSKFIDYLEWTGTTDISAYLAVPKAIDFYRQYLTEENRMRCHELASSTQAQISKLTSRDPFHPDSIEFFMQMEANPLPEKVEIDYLKNQLYNEFKVEIPVIEWKKRKLIRSSYQIYNDEKDIESLIRGLTKLL